MSAEATVAAGPAEPAAQLAAALKTAGVVHGLDQELILETGTRLLDPSFSFRGVIARGEPSLPGKDGRMEPAAKPGPHPGAALAGDRIDFHERGLLQPAHQDDVVGRHHRPQPGKPGRDVRGKAIPAPPVKDTGTRLGQGVVERDDLVRAARDGVVLFTDGKLIDVVPLYKHDGNVDLKSGNLRTGGSLLVGGDVCPDFRVEADGDVVVKGTVQGAVTADSIVVDQGVQGDGSDVRANSNLVCRHATNARLHAGSTLRLLDQAVQCRARAERIELLKGRGRVIAGELRARHKVTVLEAGSDNGPVTVLAAGDVTDLHTSRTRQQADENKVQRLGQKLAANDRGKGGKLQRAAVQLGDQAQAERIAVLKVQRELLEHAEVEIRGTAHIGVRVQLGDSRLDLKEAVTGARFRWDADRAAIVNVLEKLL
jgi:hypothetical protein